MRRRYDISLAERTLGWTPQVPLDKGLRRTIDYFDDLLVANGSSYEARGAAGGFPGGMMPFVQKWRS
jgi:hypothetical protein